VAEERGWRQIIILLQKNTVEVAIKRFNIAISILPMLISLIAILPQLVRGQGYNDVGTVRGHVEILNHPSLGRTPCRNCAFLIYRKECPRAIIYIETDVDGNYNIRIGLGTWRIAMKEQAGERTTNALSLIDMLAKDQPREFKISSPLKALIFDIKVSVK
jgi:hypothetical protein